MHDPRDDRLRARKAVSLNDELARYLGTLDPKTTQQTSKLQRAWEKVASPKVREHTDAVIFSKYDTEPIILVYVDDSSWAAELNMQREFYRIMMERELSQTVVEVRFFVSRNTALRKK